MDKSRANIAAHGIADSAPEIIRDIWYLETKECVLIRVSSNASLTDLSHIALIAHSEADKWFVIPHDTFKTNRTVQVVSQDTKWVVGSDQYIRPRQVSDLPGWMAKDWYESSTLLVSK